MGRGIAMAFANSGIPVTMMDVSQAAAEKGLQAIQSDYQGRVKRGRMSAEDAAKRIALISISVDYADLARADVVIEAVFESMTLKKSIFEKLDEHCKPGAILASNTSTLDLAEIAAVTKRPEAVIGLHFFSPAHVMRLLEIVRAEKTGNAVIATSMKLAGKLRKIGVLASNQYGFIGNRMMDPYGREAERMLLEGATPRQIDEALERFGMAMGILAVFDLAGVDVGYKIRQERQAFLPDDPSFYRASALLVEHGMLGQKSGSGYYRYEPGTRERFDNPEALQMFANEAARLGIPQRKIPDQEIVERCLYSLINEGAMVLEERVALRASDVDVVYTAGYGFPRHRGGPMFYADTVGLKIICDRIDEFATKLDPQYWKAANLLRELSERNDSIAEYANV
jgi:3-hydroxyacyl-CoA dehydrogenase